MAITRTVQHAADVLSDALTAADLAPLDTLPMTFPIPPTDAVTFGLDVNRDALIEVRVSGLPGRIPVFQATLRHRSGAAMLGKVTFDHATALVDFVATYAQTGVRAIPPSHTVAQ
ncbi:hypothetical protein ACFCZ3_20195 [Cellulosimicrobium cellulans]|uniref:hypothetical protein n=1 Tax=Cellulosimicrobium cellulans TaxID=1710 RepID=UPI0035E0A725